MVAYYTGSNPIEMGDFVSKVKVTVTQYPFFLTRIYKDKFTRKLTHLTRTNETMTVFIITIPESLNNKYS